jgi:hypothetical protein
MELKVIWHKPVRLRDSRADANGIYEIDLHKIPEKPGIYIFMRVFGKKQNPLYIGKARRLRSRIKQQLQYVKLMRGIENAANGSRVVIFGEFVPKKGQQQAKCLSLIEKAMIRHFLSEGHNLLNKAGTSLAHHSLASEHIHGRLVPAKILFE